MSFHIFTLATGLRVHWESLIRNVNRKTKKALEILTTSMRHLNIRFIFDFDFLGHLFTQFFPPPQHMQRIFIGSLRETQRKIF